MVLCVSREAGLSCKAEKWEVHWTGSDWVRVPFKCFETAQSFHANTRLVQTYQAFNNLVITALVGF